MCDKQREQQLIDIMFEIATGSKSCSFKNHEVHMKWVAAQLRELGFPTTPVGSSWGVLNKE